ncbi:rod shape-determining protein MreC [uncultured Adlercreutzia sp.]|uniref:rod shape-determining protein MreC n=1 Tax=uncultured Adlercreutzia sp. TaxID=875803 RepID=UPI0025F7F222|nr:rod shape-determining protein MreC [uncultured Adlercreutzia sp.]
MALNFQNHSPAPLGRVSLIATLLVSLVCIGIYQAEGATGPLHSVQAAVAGIMTPAQQVSAPLGAAVESAEQSAADDGAAEETLSALREQNAQLVQQIATAEEQRLENERLRGLLNLRDIYEITGVSGRVIGRTTDAWNQTVTLDVGSNSGVESGLTVMGPTGVVGQVISVTGSTCRVRLLTDPQSGAAAMVQSSRAEGIVRGSMDGLLYLENIGADVNIQVGDVVLTSGLGGSYTRGLVIGTVARVEGSAGTDTRKIIVAPNGTVSLMEEALVVFSAADDAAERAITAPVTTTEGEGDGEGDGSEGDATGSGDSAENGNGSDNAADDARDDSPDDADNTDDEQGEGEEA